MGRHTNHTKLCRLSCPLLGAMLCPASRGAQAASCRLRNCSNKTEQTLNKLATRLAKVRSDNARNIRHREKLRTNTLAPLESDKLVDSNSSSAYLCETRLSQEATTRDTRTYSKVVRAVSLRQAKRNESHKHTKVTLFIRKKLRISADWSIGPSDLICTAR